LRRLRIAAPIQLPLTLPDVVAAADRWWALPEPTQAQVLTLLARLIAKGVIDEEASDD
jgi:hypothetical protein